MTGIKVIAGAAALLAGRALGAQPGAAQPAAVPMRPLQWGRLNFLHTTDTHGWHGGHLQEGQYSGDWGDYVSFAAHMRAEADRRGVDLLVVDTGDRVEGNGLYDASSPKGRYTYDVFREQHLDLISSGNHELYVAATADREAAVSVPNFPGAYIASNLDYVNPATGLPEPLAPRYRRLRTKHQGLRVTALGFLFDFTGNANNTVVHPVRKVVREPWFRSLAADYETDIFVVIGHVGIRMDEFKVVYAALREHHADTPIVFLGGHAHVRDATSYGPNSIAVASGRYLETIGWVSVDNLPARRGSLGTSPPKNEPTFARRYIDNNVLGLQHHSNTTADTFPTEHGKRVSAFIGRARTRLELDHKIGCAPRTLWMSRAPHGSDDSVFTWLEQHVLPDVLRPESRRGRPTLALMNTGGIRFDIFEGRFTRDATYIVSPFVSGFRFVRDVPYAVASKVLEILNAGGTILADAAGGDVRLMAVPEAWSGRDETAWAKADDYMPETDRGAQAALVGGTDRGGGGDEVLVSGYTTRDDFGNDGDDAVHSPIRFYQSPNCIQAQINMPPSAEGESGVNAAAPETVDLVFLDFIQPWVLVALRLAGGRVYDDGDVEKYIEGTFSQLMEQWIAANWKGDC